MYVYGEVLEDLEFSSEEKALIKKLIYEVEEALSVLELRVREGVRNLSDAVAVFIWLYMFLYVLYG